MLKSITLVTALFAGSLAHASSHEINIQPVRDFMQTKVLSSKTGRLSLTNKLDEAKPPKGVSAQAVTKAHQTLVGLQGFNSGSKGANYYRDMGNEKLVISAVDAHDPSDYTKTIQRFVARSDKQGLVVARGFVKDGAITYTRMHNEHAATTPAERNAAATK
jgi:hypothetical protein